MVIERVLIIDDDEMVCETLAALLARLNLEVKTSTSGKKGLAQLNESSFDLIITDMHMPDMTGLEVIRRVHEQLNAPPPVVVLTGHGTVENAVEAMKLGAYNYLVKPFTPESIEAIIEKANQHLTLVNENQYLRQQSSVIDFAEGQRVIIASPYMQKILEDVKRVAKSNAHVFITGESGTGKEVMAQVLHDNSQRAKQPYIKVNCAAIPESLIESEFFGHEKGAFTGAAQKRIGRFELAHNGTLLLDEVTEIPVLLQAKLLRVIQEQIFERVGGNKSINVNVRLISTSNQDLKDAIASKKLREDLYYRLNVVPIHIPPLRERPEDIIPLADYFLEMASVHNHQERKKLSDRGTSKLLEYHWPGNVRELGNVIERAVVLGTENVIGPDQLLLQAAQSSPGLGIPVGMTLQELEKKLIIETLHAQHNDEKKAAEILGITPRALHNKLQQFEAKS